MANAVLPQYFKQKHTADKASSTGAATTIYAVQITSNGGVTDVELNDAATDTSSDDLVYSVPDGETYFFDYTPLGGVRFATDLTVDITVSAGTGSVIIWTDIRQATA